MDRSPPSQSNQAPIAGAAFHSGALTAWLGLAVAPSLLTQNPLYLALALAVVALLYDRLARRAPMAAAWGGFAKMALFFLLFTLAFNTLLGGASGGSTVLLELPAWRVQGEDGATLFQIGGAVTAESLVVSLTVALALLVVIYALATFNILVDHDQLLRRLPRFIDQAATVVAIALTFLPQLFAAQREIRQAQALRGHQIRGLRDLAPLLRTLLAEALERALALAESMEARGFSRAPGDGEGGARRHVFRLAIAAGLACVLVGAAGGDLGVAALAGGGGLALALVGAALVGVVLWRIGRGVRRSRYRREVWTWRDTALTAVAVLGLAVLLGLRLHDAALFQFQAYPRISRPPFDPRVAGGLLVAALPLVLARSGERS